MFSLVTWIFSLAETGYLEIHCPFAPSKPIGLDVVEIEAHCELMIDNSWISPKSRVPGRGLVDVNFNPGTAISIYNELEFR
jgi:hypothetical protein